MSANTCWILSVLCCLALCGCSRSSKMNTWVLVSENGCKPGTAILLTEKDGKVSDGKFFILDPNYPRDLSKGKGLVLKNIVQENKTIKCMFSLIDESSTTRTQDLNITIIIKTEFRGSKVYADLQEDDSAKMTVVFERSDDMQNESLFFIPDGSKFGYVDCYGKIVIPPRYAIAHEFAEGRARVSVVGSIRDGGLRWGFIDYKGNIVIDAKYSDACDFSEGLAAVYVKVDNKSRVGFVNRDGDMIIKPQYDSAPNMIFRQGFTAVRVGGKDWFIDKQGRRLGDMVFDGAGEFTEGMAVVLVGDKYGFINDIGRMVIEPKYEKAMSFTEGLALVCLGGKWGFIDKTGHMVIEARFDSGRVFSEGLAVVNLDGKAGYIDHNGKFAIEPVYEDCMPFISGFGSVKSGGKWGFVNRIGLQVVASAYDNSSDFHDGLACVKVSEKWGFIDTQGNWVIPPKFDTYGDFRSGAVRVIRGKTCLLLDRKGAILRECVIGE